MLIAQISDTHIMSPDANEPKSLARMRALAQFVAHINERFMIFKYLNNAFVAA